MVVRKAQRWETPCMCEDHQADQLAYVLPKWAQNRSIGMYKGVWKSGMVYTFGMIGLEYLNAGWGYCV